MTEETKELYDALFEATSLACELCYEKGCIDYDYEGEFNIEHFMKDGCPGLFMYVRSNCPAKNWLKILAKVKEGNN